MCLQPVHRQGFQMCPISITDTQSKCKYVLMPHIKKFCIEVGISTKLNILVWKRKEEKIEKNLPHSMPGSSAKEFSGGKQWPATECPT